MEKSHATTAEDVRYLDDLQPGQRFRSGTQTITADEIKVFAYEFDPQPFHLNELAARGSLFGALAASGWHTAALTMRLLVTSLPLAGGIIGRGGEVRWPGPTRPGDVLRVEAEVVAVTPSRSKADRGTVRFEVRTLNQTIRRAKRCRRPPWTSSYRDVRPLPDSPGRSERSRSPRSP